MDTESCQIDKWTVRPRVFACLNIAKTKLDIPFIRCFSLHNVWSSIRMVTLWGIGSTYYITGRFKELCLGGGLGKYGVGIVSFRENSDGIGDPATGVAGWLISVLRISTSSSESLPRVRSSYDSDSWNNWMLCALSVRMASISVSLYSDGDSGIIFSLKKFIYRKYAYIFEGIFYVKKH